MKDLNAAAYTERYIVFKTREVERRNQRDSEKAMEIHVKKKKETRLWKNVEGKKNMIVIVCYISFYSRKRRRKGKGDSITLIVHIVYISV